MNDPIDQVAQEASRFAQILIQMLQQHTYMKMERSRLESMRSIPSLEIESVKPLLRAATSEAFWKEPDLNNAVKAFDLANKYADFDPECAKIADYVGTRGCLTWGSQFQDAVIGRLPIDATESLQVDNITAQENNYPKQVIKDGEVEYYDEKGRLHRDDGPAFVRQDGTGWVREWFQHGQLHRNDGPAKIFYDKDGNITLEAYYLNGKQHRLDAPAEYRYKAGVLIYEGWFQNDRVHREDGPAWTNFTIVGLPGEKVSDLHSQSWYLFGVMHREDGPARITYDRDAKTLAEEWWQKGKRHRLDGPAVIEYDYDGKIRRTEWHQYGQELRPIGSCTLPDVDRERVRQTIKALEPVQPAKQQKLTQTAKITR